MDDRSFTLTHLPLDKMAAISQTEILSTFSLKKRFQTSLRFVPKGSIGNKAALVEVMAWHQTGDKPLPKSMLAQFTNTYMRH